MFRQREFTSDNIKIVEKEADLLIIGGGTAGCYAGYTAKVEKPELKVLIIEKAQIERSGCLAAGINAINAYLNPGETTESFLEYVKKDSAGLVREDLVLSIAEGLNKVTKQVEEWGLPILKDDAGNYVPRGKRSIRINGERIKPIIAKAVKKAGVEVLNRTVATNYIMVEGRVVGAYAFNVREGTFYVLKAKAVICTTGGASGLYRPNNGGSSRHKMWYSPFNTGAGYAMGIRAGAEMTTFEMRFIALRVKDVIAPTGTLAQGVKAVQVNALKEPYLARYGNSTPQRLWATIEENKAGRGPCYLDTTHLTEEQGRNLKEAYLNMCPGTVLLWANQGINPQDAPIEIMGSEPYVVGGHGQAGYWVNKKRQATIPGLFAAGDVAGGAPKKYVTGCFVEGEIAAKSAIDYINDIEKDEAKFKIPTMDQIQSEYERVYRPLLEPGSLFSEELEERLQKLMDEYAGGISVNYELCENKLLLARQFLLELDALTQELKAEDFHQLLEVHEVIDRIKVARVLIEHLIYRRETRWLCYQSRVDFPERDDQNWFKFVNSLYDPEKDEIKILEREFIPAGE